MRPVRQALLTLVLLTTGAACWMPAGAQSQRDPTLPPWSSGGGRPAGGDAPTKVRGIHGPVSVLVVDGKPFLVVGTRLYAQGQTIGAARIERISETEVWLREGSNLRKISNFAGIQRHSVGSTAASPDCSGVAPELGPTVQSFETPAPVASCDKGQP